MNSPSRTNKASTAILAQINRFSRRFTGFTLLAVAFLLATLIVVTGPTAEPSEQIERAWPVSIIPATPQTLSPVMLNFGRVEAQQTANLNTTISARVSRVIAREGDWVEKGDLLLELDPTEVKFMADSAQARLARSEATLESLQVEYELAKEITEANRNLADVAAATLSRARDLHNKHMIADAQLDTAIREANQGKIALAQHLSELNRFPARIDGQRAAIEETRADAERAKFDLSQTQVRAPFTGRVLASPFAVGERVAPGISLVTLADYATLEIRSTLPTPVARKLELQLRDGYTLNASSLINGERIRFTLSRIGGAVRPGQSGLDAFFTVAANAGLEIGAVIDLALELPPEEQVLAMPLYSLYEDSTIYRIREQRLEALHYERVGDYLDSSGDFLALIRIDELQQGDTLLGSQLSRAISGLLVSPIVEEATQL